MKNAYCNSSNDYGLCTSYNTAVGSILTDPNQFYLGVDTEIIARKGSLLSGINTSTAPMMFRAQVGATLAAYNHIVNFFGFYDVILEIDMNSRDIIALV